MIDNNPTYLKTHLKDEKDKLIKLRSLMSEKYKN